MKEFSYRIPDYRPHELPIQLLDDGREFVSIDDLNDQSIVFLVVLGDGWSCGPLGLFGPSIRESGLSAGQIKTIERARWRHRAHLAFDPIWKEEASREPPLARKFVREKYYAKLANEMGLSLAACHMAFMTVEQCQCVVKICNSWVERKAQYERAIASD